MKFIKDVRNWGLVFTICLIASVGAIAQGTTPTPAPQNRDRMTGNPKAEIKPEKPAPTPTPADSGESADPLKKGGSTDSGSESTTLVATEKKEPVPQETPVDDPTAQVVNYYVNYLKEYRLGPEDVISVEVFGQPNYSKSGIVIPPTATISYQLIPGGVFVAGKSTDQVGQEIARKLNEYIIDPQVTVTLEKVGSARYAVMGDVTQPGIRLMTRRVTVVGALTEAGGILATGSKSKAVIFRTNGLGAVSQVPVNIDSIMKGKEKDIDIQPGDQIFIPGNKMKTFLGVIDTVSKLSGFRMLFGSPF